MASDQLSKIWLRAHVGIVYRSFKNEDIIYRRSDSVVRDRLQPTELLCRLQEGYNIPRGERFNRWHVTDNQKTGWGKREREEGKANEVASNFRVMTYRKGKRH